MPAPSSNVSTPLTPSPHVPTFDYIVSKIFNKSLIADSRNPQLAIRNQQQEESTVAHSEQPTTSSATTTTAKQPQNRRIEIVAAPPITASKIHHPIRLSQHLPNVHAERMTLRISSPHLNQLLKRCNTLQTSSRPKSTSPQE